MPTASERAAALHANIAAASDAEARNRAAWSPRMRTDLAMARYAYGYLVHALDAAETDEDTEDQIAWASAAEEHMANLDEADHD